MVDDESGVRSLLGRVLGNAGYTVLEACDATEALERTEHHDAPIQLMITDVGLPDVDGRELAARFLRLRPEAKIMFMSGSVILDGTANAPFLPKPFALADLLGRVRTLTCD